MKKIAFLMCLAGCASQPQPTWKAGQDVGTARRTSAAELAKVTEGSEIVLDGKVTRVCQNRGCWVEIDGVIAKSLKHDILFPKDCAGKRAVVRGVLRQAPEEKKEEGEHKEDCPQPKVIVEILGARLY
ncbi:MAG: DUF4920 domain-containing protein [Planctomycetes bacterium]|nr:DUF4920 domain-containing protein [Planctomycetota bacterium]